MIDVSRLITDPDFCEPFVIRRRVGKWEAGRFIATPEDTAVTGIVEPTSGDDLEQVPEGDPGQRHDDLLYPPARLLESGQTAIR